MYAEVMGCAVERWTSIWGDPIVPAGIAMAGYALAAYLSWRVVQRETGRERVLWGLSAVVLVVLFFNTHLDLHAFIGSYGRCHARAFGWYEQRETVQLLFVAGVIGTIALLLVLAVVLFARNLIGNLLLVSGFAISAGYMLAKGAGHHQTDMINNLAIGPLTVSAVSEILGGSIIALAALLKLRSLRRMA